MTTDERREEILNTLKISGNPIKGLELAKKFDVSRQVIVQDIAILRAEGIEIIATPIGYVVPKVRNNRIIKTLVTKHSNIEQVEDELMIIINNGGRIIDVVVSHSVYGDMRGELNLSCKSDVDKFLKDIENGDSELLSSLTGGVHIHTIEVPNNDSFLTIKNELDERGYIVKNV